jgi:hypothetical protein
VEYGSFDGLNVKAGAAAAVAIGEDMAALVLFGVRYGIGDGGLHCPPHWVKSVQSLLKKRPASGLPRMQVWFKCESPAWWPGVFFSFYFYFNGLSETKMPSLADLFFARKRSRLFGFPTFVVEFGHRRGLTCDFWAKSDRYPK